MKKIVLLFLMPVLMLSCGKGPETITVNSGPLVPTDADADTSMVPPDETESDFIQFTIGEFDPIHSLDPLFAASNSELRMISLMYEGLVGINSLGNLQPALARRWDVNVDSTRFTFHLKTNVYFHDSNVFGSGIGRKFSASDVKFVFERMASMQVPDKTAERFKNIRGFSAFRNEQSYVKNPSQRVVNSINGIEVRNDSTVLFIMNRSSGNLLKNMAHPSASIYPKESANAGRPPIQNPVGTGKFYLVKKEQNRYILSVNKEYAGKKPKLNRLDIISGLSDGDLFQSFAKGEIDALIELSPSTIQTALNEDGNLAPGYSEKYTLENIGINAEYSLFFNTESGQKTAASQFLSNLNANELMQGSNLGTVSVLPSNLTDSTNAPVNNQFSITHTDITSEVYLINQFATAASSAGFSTSMNPSYAISDEVTFSTKKYPHTIKAVTWKKPLYILMQDNVSGITFNKYPWNIDLSGMVKSGGL